MWNRQLLFPVSFVSSSNMDTSCKEMPNKSSSHLSTLGNQTLWNQG
uniref:Uncharacterized protein n=1 Tax=Anguilla anguilla TaxID=7936 RepID=A0A0E9SVZ5_ANGAN